MIKTEDGLPLVGQHTLDYGNDPYVAPADITFRYTQNSTEGLLMGKKAILIVGSGGIQSDGPASYAWYGSEKWKLRLVPIIFSERFF